MAIVGLWIGDVQVQVRDSPWRETGAGRLPHFLMEQGNWRGHCHSHHDCHACQQPKIIHDIKSRRAWELIIIICTSSGITRLSDRQIISKTNTSAFINMSKCKTRFIWIVVNSIEIDSIPARICHHSLPQVMGRTGMSWRKYFFFENLDLNRNELA